jgi:hypothetical protein
MYEALGPAEDIQFDRVEDRWQLEFSIPDPKHDINRKIFVFK